MKNLSTNSKEVKKAIEIHILDCVYNETEETFTNIKDACIHLNSEFERVANYPNNLQKFPNDQNRFQDYLQGIPFYFEFENYKIEDFLNGLGINQEKKDYSTSKMWNLYTYLIFRQMKKNL
tara:strand:+ start:33 stop:395 length:363 start_codon:yes stop_codon:yes gene_type:complete